MNEKQRNVAGGGVSFWGILAIVFITLKLLGVITWAWGWVLLPLWGPVALAVVVLLGFALIGAIVKSVFSR